MPVPKCHFQTRLTQNARGERAGHDVVSRAPSRPLPLRVGLLAVAVREDGGEGARNHIGAR